MSIFKKEGRHRPFFTKPRLENPGNKDKRYPQSSYLTTRTYVNQFIKYNFSRKVTIGLGQNRKVSAVRI